MRPDFRHFHGVGLTELLHSYKGTTWTNHKYIRKENGRYIYSKDENATVGSVAEQLETTARASKAERKITSFINQWNAHTLGEGRYLTAVVYENFDRLIGGKHTAEEAQKYVDAFDLVFKLQRVVAKYRNVRVP